jgi:proteasome lid subunit RPN8/RPN11
MTRPEAVLPAPGQVQALNELYRIVDVSRSGMGMTGEPDLTEDGAWLHVDLWLDCTGAFSNGPGAVELGRRERLRIYLPAQFPFQYPRVEVPHRRFSGLPHVQWGRSICLYASPNDWDASEGMWGFIDRLLAWYLRAARGQLADPGFAWHPPVTYGRGSGGILIVRADLPNAHEGDEATWTGWGVVAATGEDCYELRQWVPAASISRPDQLRLHIAEANKSQPEPLSAVPLIALPKSLGFEYPDTVGELVQALRGHDIDVADCEALLQQARAINSDLAASVSRSAEAPLILLIGSPATDRNVALGRVAHLAGWRIPNPRAAQVGAESLLDWMRVYDQRPRSTVRRDTDRPVEWLRDRGVLILGCGALGAPIAEHCARAGVRSLTVVDNGTVNPGILVRQPYRHCDIGRSKARALRERLGAVAPQITIDGRTANALAFFADDAILPPADLIIDATADRSVAARIERRRWSGGTPFPPILSVMVGHQSEHGLATLSLPKSTGAGIDALRRFAVAASSDQGLADVLDDFYPDPPRSDVFQPEPGCSDPTFVGSAADLAALAAQMLNAALTVLNDTPGTAAGAHQPTRSAMVARNPAGLRPQGEGACLQWGNDLTENDKVHRYQVRIDQAALAAIRREVLRAAAVNPRDETGGVLLGQVDNGCRVVWVSEARGLPSGSEGSPGGLHLNISDLRGELAARRRSSRGLVSFIGAWHTHPGGPPTPSDKDHRTMDSLVNGEQETLPQALLVVLGGIGGRWQRWVDGIDRPQMHAELFFPPFR